MRVPLNAALIYLALLPSVGVCASTPETPWSEPQSSTLYLGSDTKQQAKQIQRSYKETADRRVVETKTAATLQSANSKGQYTLLRKNIYSKNKLVTAYRKMKATLAGSSPLSLIEQTQISKTGDDLFEGNVVREFVAGKNQSGPAARVTLHFEHRMLLTAYTVKISAKDKDGSWPVLGAATAGSVGEALYDARKAMEKAPATAQKGFADHIVNIWSESVDQNPLELATVLYPFLNVGGAASFNDVDVAPLMDITRKGLTATGRNQAERTQLIALAEKLASSRSALAKAIKKGPSSASDKTALPREYFSLAQSLNEAPRAVPSLLQSLQTNLEMTADSYYASQRKGPFQTEPRQWSLQRMQAHADVYLRALQMMVASKEAAALKNLSAEANKGPRQEALVAELDQTRDRLLTMPAPQDKSALGSGAVHSDLYMGFPMDAMSWTPDVAMAMMRATDLPENTERTVELAEKSNFAGFAYLASQLKVANNSPAPAGGGKTIVIPPRNPPKIPRYNDVQVSSFKSPVSEMQYDSGQVQSISNVNIPEQ